MEKKKGKRPGGTGDGSSEKTSSSKQSAQVEFELKKHSEQHASPYHKKKKGKSKSQQLPEKEVESQKKEEQYHFQDQPQQAPSQSSQGVWARGPPAGQSQPQQGPSQTPQGAWARGPPAGQSQPQQGPSQTPQGAWPRGPPAGQSQPQQGRSQTPQGAWARGPPAGQSQPQQGRSQTPQGAWARGPPAGQSQPQQGPSQTPQGAWPRGPPISQSQPQQGPSQPPQVPRARGPTSSEVAVSKMKFLRMTDTEKVEQSSEPPGLLEFAPRIYAREKFGRIIQVASNFYPLILNPNIIAYHYDVTIEPDKPKYLMRTVWNKFVSLMCPNKFPAFDGKNAYSKGPLINDISMSASVTVNNPQRNMDIEFQVTVKEVRRIDFSFFKNYREKLSKDRSTKILPEAEVAVLDIILNNWACDNSVRSGRQFFPYFSDNPETVDLSKKLSLRSGYFQAAFVGYKLYLNFDISYKAFYKNCPVLNILDCFREGRSNDLNVDEMTAFMRTVKVNYKLPNDPSSGRVFTVNKLVGDAYHTSFKKEDGTELSVAKYFETEKKCRIANPNLPLLSVGPIQKSIYVPMEFCTILPDQVYKGFVDSFEIKKITQTSTQNARDRRKKVENLFNQVNINSHPLLREFELKVLNEMEKVPARVLNPPLLTTSRIVKVSSGAWKIQDFLVPVTLSRWCILNVDKYVRKENIISLQNMIKTKGNEFNMRITDPSKTVINADPSFMGLKKVFSQLKDMEMVFVIIPETKLVYSRVKAICETQDGILTQCVKSKTISQDPRKLSTTVQNILLKVNAKLGGKNHSLHKDCVPKCLDGYVMVVGADVTHASPGMNIPSVAAVTVSSDPAAFQYSTSTRIQPKGEIIRDLNNIIKHHLKEFYNIRKHYPEKIIFFRDGVSEGELEKVLKEEITAVRNACNGYCQPKITFVVVQKRHHTRFYPTSAADESDRNYNVPVGTCVDSDIIHPRDLDFYLVSHSSILGTARPTRYRLLYDDNKLTDFEVETLSYYLCHLFSRCNRSVSYPVPTYNAHLAAARVRAYLEGLNLMRGQDINDIQNQMKDEISKISPMFFV